MSELAGDTNPGEIARIVRVSRSNNVALGLTGLMMFDGAVFCQNLEGPEPAVRNTLARIARDTRHTRFQPIHHAPLAERRRFEAWHFGILAPNGPSPLLAFRSLRGDAAIDHLVQVFQDNKNYGIHVI